MNKVGHLTRARNNVDDEYYTTAKQVDKAIDFFIERIRGKKVYCPCDSENSQFWIRLKARYDELRLEGLIATSYAKEGHGTLLEFDGKNVIASEMTSDGSFESDESKAIMGEAGFVITNPPFSKMSLFVKTLCENSKCDFAFLSGVSSMSSIELLKYVAKRRIHSTKLGRISISGANSGRTAGCCWMSSVKELSNEFKPTTMFSDMAYDVFDQHNDVINVNRVKDIPADYAGFMGVPITAVISGLLDSGYELVGIAKNYCNTVSAIPEQWNDDKYYLFTPYVNGKLKFNRLIVRKTKDTIS